MYHPIQSMAFLVSRGNQPRLHTSPQRSRPRPSVTPAATRGGAPRSRQPGRPEPASFPDRPAQSADPGLAAGPGWPPQKAWRCERSWSSKGCLISSSAPWPGGRGAYHRLRQPPSWRRCSLVCRDSLSVIFLTGTLIMTGPVSFRGLTGTMMSSSAPSAWRTFTRTTVGFGEVMPAAAWRRQGWPPWAAGTDD
jgi:hypothetical protein